jgi:uncharacterized protein
VGSELWFHLPPAAPPFFLLASVPLKANLSERRLPSLITNPFVRNLSLLSLSLAILSWGHAQLDRKKLLEPLPIPVELQDIARARLPPFLPEIVEHEWDLINDDPVHMIEDFSTEQFSFETKNADTPRTFRKHMTQISNFSPRPQSINIMLQKMREKRILKRTLRNWANRLEIYDQLIAIQDLKRQIVARRRNTQQTLKIEGGKHPLGYALVTGASRGIGRALAVELARWEIPLILVARDEKRLIKLATDLERCYGVTCYVLPADLSQPDAAEKIYKATAMAGLDVDILINNAGLSSHGEFVDMEETNLRNILQVNAISVATLSHLYGSDMKKRRRGRILMVSSVVGVSYAAPTVGAYAATKAFEKVLGLSMAKELEVYGVGVTCLLPGAVGDSHFRKNSGSSRALCWNIPFYVKSCEHVADQGVRALLQGDLEVIPGWQNRAFAKILLPILPHRAITIIVETAWNPLSHLKPTLSRSAKKVACEDTDTSKFTPIPILESLSSTMKEMQIIDR